jgi:pilus assembly protein CpaC
MKSTVTRGGIRCGQMGYMVIIVLTAGAFWAYDSAAESGDVSGPPETITVIIGESAIIQAPWPTVRVAVTDPTIANVQVLTPEQVLVQGIKAGTTDLILWSEDEQQVWQRRVQVKMDTARFKNKLNELFPDCLLEVSESGEVLIVKGLLRKTDQVTQLNSFLDKAKLSYVDMTSVAGVQQVQLRVRFAEVSRNALRALGVNAFHTDDDFFLANRLGDLVPISIGVPADTVAGDHTSFVFNRDTQVSTPITMFGGIPRADFEIFLEALAENQYLRILANPTLVAQSGEEASFLAGGEFPVPVPQSGAGTGVTTITIEYKEFGVRLLFRPIVLGDNTIRLSVTPEVSELSQANAVLLQGFYIPGLITRKAQTTLELQSGQTFAMAGLIKNKTQAINSRIPGLGDLPVLGPLFRSVRYTEDESELVVLVTVSLVEPMSLADTPPLPGILHTRPDDWELYLEGRIEGAQPANIDPTNAEWLKKMGLDRLLGPGAWDSYGEPIPSSQAETKLNPADVAEPAAGAEETEQ